MKIIILLNLVSYVMQSYLIYEYEKRVIVTSASYDNSNMPWKLSIDLQCHLLNDKFNEFHIIIDFSNNRYCEVI